MRTRILRSDDDRLTSRLSEWTMLVWIFAYLASTAFHIHETKLTERLDYFFPVFATTMQLVWGIAMVISDVRRRPHIWLPVVVAPLALFALYFMHYMIMIKFDYGWQNKVVIVLLVLDSLVFVPWLLANASKKPHVVAHLVLANVAIVAGVWFELNDFRPVCSLIYEQKNS